MRISNKFDEASVYDNGIYYFPQDESKLVKKQGQFKATIQAVYKTHKYVQDTLFICPIRYIELLEYYVKNTDKRS